MKYKILCALLLAGAISAHAAKPKHDVKAVIDAFIQSYLKHGDYRKLQQVLGSDVTFRSNRQTKVVVQQGANIVDFMKKNAGLVQRDCTVNYEVVSKTSAIVVARIDINYALNEGSQQNYLILENDGTGDWKITQVYKLFLENEEGAEITAGKV
ncbi:hypothetical protein C7T94_02920 [Pedobacter yulinensis]|uniref:Nuclear transport factor 2 family protein n=1 Tax=Pedobacter yulinensis TaxID=2126353 RepID=A0A2T3HRQ6_9SPHI|nr:hypothetical protein [Pedobacter yulinensis]PST85081.1 hypothetical protein C7T94_02920 [Pedobacter yulinensis]